MTINTNTIIGDLISKSLGLDIYEKIMKDWKQVNISEDEEFQKTFNYFYKVRRAKAWRIIYYDLFEENKNNKNLRFEYIIRNMYDKTGRIEASFSSKLLATINPSMPIWDQYVLQRLELGVQGKTKEERLKNTILLYDDIINWYEDFLRTDNAKESISLFNSAMPNFLWMSDTKKIDFLIWGIGSKKECT